MTRKDYVLIAKAVRQYRDHITSMMQLEINAPREEINRFRLEGADWTIHYLANALVAENPRFNRKQFEVACGLHDEAIREVIASLNS